MVKAYLANQLARYKHEKIECEERIQLHANRLKDAKNELTGIEMMIRLAEAEVERQIKEAKLNV